MPTAGFYVPWSGAPCPPADDPEAILIWLHWQHLQSGRIEKRQEHHDPFWRRIEEKRQERLRYTEELAEADNWQQQVQRLATMFDLGIAELDKDAQIEVVTCAMVPMRFHISGALEELGQHERAMQVKATRW